MNEIDLICEICRFPIAAGKGSLYVRMGDVREKRDADQQWRDSHPFGTRIDITEFLLLPGPAHWRSAHDACRSDHDESCYELDDEWISTWRGLAHWTAHLMAKNWFASTDWAELLREAAGDVPSARIRVVLASAA